QASDMLQQSGLILGIHLEYLSPRLAKASRLIDTAPFIEERLQTTGRVIDACHVRVSFIGITLTLCREQRRFAFASRNQRFVRDRAAHSRLLAIRLSTICLGVL